MAIVTLDQARAQLDLESADQSVNNELDAYINALTPAIENYLHQVIEPRIIVKDYELRGGWSFYLQSVPVISLTSVVGLDTGITYDVSKYRAASNGRVRVLLGGVPPFGLCTVTHQAGYLTIPTNYQQGALVFLQHVWETQRGAGEAKGFVPGVVGEEELIRSMNAFTFPRKAREWFGDPAPLMR